MFLAGKDVCVVCQAASAHTRGLFCSRHDQKGERLLSEGLLLGRYPLTLSTALDERTQDERIQDERTQNEESRRTSRSTVFPFETSIQTPVFDAFVKTCLLTQQY